MFKPIILFIVLANSTLFAKNINYDFKNINLNKCNDHGKW